MTWQGTITIEQIEMLERTFCILTPEGWRCPQWLISLRHKVMWRDYRLNDERR